MAQKIVDSSDFNPPWALSDDLNAKGFYVIKVLNKSDTATVVLAKASHMMRLCAVKSISVKSQSAIGDALKRLVIVELQRFTEGSYFQSLAYNLKSS